MAESRGETAAFFCRFYINGLQLGSLLARLDSVPVVCTSPEDFQLIATSLQYK